MSEKEKEQKNKDGQFFDESQKKNVKIEQTEKQKKIKSENKIEKESKTEDMNEKRPANKTQPKKIYPDVKPGANVRVHQKIKEKKGKEEKERIQIFEGIVLSRKHGNEPGATITVRKTAKGGFGVEKIYPLHSPVIDKIEVIRQAKVRQAKLGFLRKNYKKKLKYTN